MCSEGSGRRISITSAWQYSDVLDIRPLASETEAQQCAAIMAATDPWITIGRSFDECLAIVREPSREVYVAYDGDALRGMIILTMRGAFTGYIAAVAVAEDARGGGVGSQLVA